VFIHGRGQIVGVLWRTHFIRKQFVFVQVCPRWQQGKIVVRCGSNHRDIGSGSASAVDQGRGYVPSLVAIWGRPFFLFKLTDVNEGSLGRLGSIKCVSECLVGLFQSLPLEPSNGENAQRSPHYGIAERMGFILLGTTLGLFGIGRIYRRQQDTDNRPYETRNDGRWAIVTAVVLIVGWLACIYGAILFLTTTDDLASLDRCSEDISVLAVVIPAWNSAT
jgi:hypothetical protein